MPLFKQQSNFCYCTVLSSQIFISCHAYYFHNRLDYRFRIEWNKVHTREPQDTFYAICHNFLLFFPFWHCIQYGLLTGHNEVHLWIHAFKYTREFKLHKVRVWRSISLLDSPSLTTLFNFHQIPFCLFLPLSLACVSPLLTPCFLPTRIFLSLFSICCIALHPNLFAFIPDFSYFLGSQRGVRKMHLHSAVTYYHRHQQAPEQSFIFSLSFLFSSNIASPYSRRLFHSFYLVILRTFFPFTRLSLPHVIVVQITFIYSGEFLLIGRRCSFLLLAYLLSCYRHKKS